MDIAFRRIVDTLDWCVQAQGIKVRFPAWMVMGSQEWNAISDQTRAYAYQAAKITGWSKQSLIAAVCNLYEFIDKHVANFTIDFLEDLVKEYPLEVEEVRKIEAPKITLTDGTGVRELR